MNLEKHIIYKLVIYIICLTSVPSEICLGRSFMSPSKRILRYFFRLSSGALPPPKEHLTLEKSDFTLLNLAPELAL
jgi:hypothetical protein